MVTLVWFLIGPIPASITRDSPHTLRSLLIIPPLIFILSLGLSKFIDLFQSRKPLIKILTVLILLVSFINFWKNYTGEYVKNYSWSWQYGYKQAADYIKNYGADYNKIYFSKKYGEPHEFVLFYMKYNPTKYLSDPNLVKYFRSDWYWVDSFDKFVFLNDWEVKQNVKCQMSNVKCLLITSPGNYPNRSKLMQTINFLDGKPAFDIVELPQVQ